MDLFKKVNQDLFKIVSDYIVEAEDKEKLLKNVKFVIPPVQTMCDYSTNAAMVFARVKRKSPNMCAEDMSVEISKLPYVKNVEITNGYINIVFNDEIWEEFLADIINEDNEITGKYSVLYNSLETAMQYYTILGLEPICKILDEDNKPIKDENKKVKK